MNNGNVLELSPTNSYLKISLDFDNIEDAKKSETLVHTQNIYNESNICVGIITSTTRIKNQLHLIMCVTNNRLINKAKHFKLLNLNIKNNYSNT